MLGALAAACLFGAAPMATAGGAGPGFGAELTAEVEDIHVFEAHDRGREFNDASVTIEGGLSLVFPSGIGLNAALVFEPVDGPEGDRDLHELGLYAEELYLSGPAGSGGWRVGKFNLEFGLANDAGPGLFGDELVGDYELTERIGVTVEFPLGPGPEGGAGHALSAAVFMADTTPLSDSLITSRGRLHRRDGGVSNTGAPDSAMLGLSGTAGRTGYNAGLRYQPAGSHDEVDEYGGVLGLAQGVAFAGVEAALLGEVAYFPNFDGGRDAAAFLAFGAEAAVGDVTLSAAYGLRTAQGSAASHLATFQLGYELTDDLTISAGYRFLKEEGVASHSVGLQMTFEIRLR